MTGAIAYEELVAAARKGDEHAYQSLVEPHRRELHAHCYRMLGSVHDAEDALQDALLRAWRGLARFEGRSSLRSWLYRIATNVCMDIAAHRPRRLLAADHAAPADPSGGPGEPLLEAVWVEPFPVAPEASYEQRESVELAFIAALQHLPPRQRAVLICREVLGFSAREVAELLDATVASVNSAMQRARAAIDAKLPERSQQETLRTLGDGEVTKLVQRYVDAWERGDVDELVGLLTDDAAITMPPLASWFRGREAIATFLRGWPLSGAWDWRHAPATANGQPAIACYARDPASGDYLPFALEVITLDGGRIAQIDAFVVRTVPSAEPEVLAAWPEHPVDPQAPRFERFGAPQRLSRL